MKKNMSKTLDRIVREVRRQGKLDEVTFCDLMDLSPSTFYNYKKHILHRYHDISFEDGAYIALEVENFEPKA